jgi:hypothetical protein
MPLLYQHHDKLPQATVDIAKLARTLRAGCAALR